MTVQLIGNGWRKVVATREEFEAWLNQAGSVDERKRTWLKMALGRMEPDRDFKRGIGRR